MTAVASWIGVHTSCFLQTSMMGKTHRDVTPCKSLEATDKLTDRPSQVQTEPQCIFRGEQMYRTVLN